MFRAFEAFYPSRCLSLEQRLQQLKAMAPEALSQETQLRFEALQGQRLRGVRWERYDAQGAFAEEGQRVLRTSGEVPPEVRRLAAAAGAIGGAPLAAALRLLCEDYDSSGLPDLLPLGQELASAVMGGTKAYEEAAKSLKTMTSLEDA